MGRKVSIMLVEVHHFAMENNRSHESKGKSKGTSVFIQCYCCVYWKTLVRTSRARGPKQAKSGKPLIEKTALKSFASASKNRQCKNSRWRF